MDEKMWSLISTSHKIQNVFKVYHRYKYKSQYCKNFWKYKRISSQSYIKEIIVRKETNIITHKKNKSYKLDLAKIKQFPSSQIKKKPPTVLIKYKREAQS